MNRKDMVAAAGANAEWDILIIGGGATGLGVAVDAASRGYKTLLLERDDFAKGTSSRSTKLVHGGVRYLQQGNIKLVTEALHERGILWHNAPHLVKNQSFVVPNYKWWEGPYYGIGLKVYDWMAGSLGLGPSRLLSKEETLKLAPTLDADGLRGGVLYHDGQFDDARLAINLAQTAAGQGAVLLNYCRVDGLIKADARLSGVRATDLLCGASYEFRAKAIINATGVFTDSILKLDEPSSEPIITPSQGVHIVLDAAFLPGEAAILVPHTDDGRVLFAVPWHGKIIIGTTDTPVDEIKTEPRALPEEIDFILAQIGRYLTKTPVREDIRSVFAGLRPLVKMKTSGGGSKKTAEVSRDHLITVSASGLITIAGGKWTTYRRMAQDTVDTAISQAGLPDRPCVTEKLVIYGATGSEREALDTLIGQDAGLKESIHQRLFYTRGEIVRAAREELCMTVEDALSRRTRSLLLDARAAIESAPLVAALLARELGHDEAWQKKQIQEFGKLAEGYLA